MVKKLNKKIGAPAVVHGEKGFMDWFRDTSNKVRLSEHRVQVVTSPLRTSREYLDNYDSINWSSKNISKNL